MNNKKTTKHCYVKSFLVKLFKVNIRWLSYYITEKKDCNN